MNAAAIEKFRDPSLVDFGDGRRLELLGGVLVDRPLTLSDAARPGRRGLWADAGAVFSPTGWLFPKPLPDPWRVGVPLGPSAAIALEVRPAPSGQVGLFLEQIEQWQWLTTVTPPAARMLSLFAHSGAATLALAAAGAHVVHVDASRPATAMARRNAAASGLEAAPIRWICDDARAFLAREVRRGCRYDGVVLDPPSWGHGPKGQAFSIDRDLLPLLHEIADLCDSAAGGPILLTCHSPGWNPQRLHGTLADIFGGRIQSGALACEDAGGRPLPFGSFARRSSS